MAVVLQRIAWHVTVFIWMQSSYSDHKNYARPRQPWQDIHCRIQGPAAEHVIDNFIERCEVLPLVFLLLLHVNVVDDLLLLLYYYITIYNIDRYHNLHRHVDIRDVDRFSQQVACMYVYL
jgi:phosphatidylserine/phosphatidylglycerophosphate/cardiolipin synthase-like enzyme